MENNWGFRFTVRAQMNAPAADRVPDRELMGHITCIPSFKLALLFSWRPYSLRTIVFAAQDTSSSASSRVLHLLAQHPETQARLRAEIRGLQGFGRTEDGTHNEEPPDYDALMRLPYLDGVVRETLRLNPPVSWIWRMYVQLYIDFILRNFLSERTSLYSTGLVPSFFDRRLYLIRRHLYIRSAHLYRLYSSFRFLALHFCFSSRVLTDKIARNSARRPTTLPLRRPIQCNDGTLLSSVPIARNQGVIIGIAAAHRDERVWGADAWEWRPERWLCHAAEDGEDVQGAMETRPVLEDEARYPGVYSGMWT